MKSRKNSSPESTQPIQKFLAWLDNSLISVWTGLLLIMIPLWPKIPLWSPIEQYIVRVRLEDFLILAGVSLLGIWMIRRRLSWKTPLTIGIVAYAVAGLLSMLSAMFITQTVPLQPLHVAKTVLHFVRYLQYFSLFFMGYAAIREIKDLNKILGVLIAVVLAITLYGIGQKYYYWPVYSTMNREFSKGVRLYLTPHARVQSTFAGHYDMAAFLVVVLPILFFLKETAKNRWNRLATSVTFWGGTWLMLASASRASFLSYVVMMIVAIVLIYAKKLDWSSFRHVFGKIFQFLMILFVLVLFFGEDITERILQVVDRVPAIHDSYHAANKYRILAIQTARDFIFHPPAEPPKDAISTAEIEASDAVVLVPSDQRPVTTKPRDVYVDVPDIVEVSTTSADGVVSTIKVDKGPRVWSEAAKMFGLSFGIRLDTLWPQAIQGFLMNPLFGKGYATLNKSSIGQFTEAESTDNNFLRTLGETGAVGFVIFYGIVLSVLVAGWKVRRSPNRTLAAFGLGMVCGTAGLLFNALLIDVFAASKVAQSFWLLAGLLFGATSVANPRQIKPTR